MTVKAITGTASLAVNQFGEALRWCFAKCNSFLTLAKKEQTDCPLTQ